MPDVERFRLAIRGATAQFGQVEGVTGGNGNKRLRLCLAWPDADLMTAEEIEQLLANPASPWTQAPTADPVELEGRVALARRKARAIPGGGLPPPPRGSDDVRLSLRSTSCFERDPDVVAWVLENAAGICEACSHPAPFQRLDGEPFLEVHHVRPLAEGGPDMVENAVACCPNCHRHLHYAGDRDSLRDRIIAAVDRLVDYPLKPLTP